MGSIIRRPGRYIMDSMVRRFGLVALTAVCCAQSGPEFFEKKIRPVLAEKCVSCHNSALKTPMGGLRLDSAGGLRKGGDSGPAVVPGEPARSLLLQAIGYTRLDLKMPPTGKLSDDIIADFRHWIERGAEDPRAVTAGSSPASVPPAIEWGAARRHWAFQPLRKPDPPAVRNSGWASGAIDEFIYAKLKRKRITPAPPAARRVWLRRVTFDLTGLPPTPDAIESYLKDTSQNAERTVVDRLLDSPHYGERWARHWLDLMRFAETNGHEFDNDKIDAWRYRDYVIRAFNQDVPYDRFVREHIAGDLLPAKRVSLDGRHWESPLGTSMFWFGEVLNSATDSVKSRADTVDNQIDVMSKAFLGLTVSCARCHDHKFDPIPTTDYYALAGIMHSTGIREAVIDSPGRAAAIETRTKAISAVNEKIRQLLPAPAGSRTPEWMRRETDAVFQDFEGLDYENWIASGAAFGTSPAHRIPPNQPLRGYAEEGVANSYGVGTDRLVGSLTSPKFVLPKLWVHIRMAGSAPAQPAKEDVPVRVTLVADDHKSQHFFPSGKPAFEWKTIRMTKEIGRNCYFEIVDRSPNGHIVVDKIVFSDDPKPPGGNDAGLQVGPVRLEDGLNGERFESLRKEREALERAFPESAFGTVARDEAPANVRLHIRGSHKNLGAEVPRRFLRVIAGDQTPPILLGSGRLELAQWMGDARNPLTARVMANRIWKHHFGQGLVRTPDNFGKTGEAPSNPELLDYVASEFVEHGWSVKHLHRMIVTSSAYRMSGKADPAAAKLDPRNDLVHSMPVRRLEAEAIRDSILAVTGQLDRTLYGRSVMPHIGKYQDGRGKPKSGPIDGLGRRSIYIQVRRNFITPMFLVFDYPLPVSTIGNRGVSNVPAQALLMMNNEFVASSAEAWAKRIMASPLDDGSRIDGMYLAAFGRNPEAWERREAIRFLEGMQTPEQGWVRLCHVLLNSAEFIFVR
jgi:hypothetical protein